MITAHYSPTSRLLSIRLADASEKEAREQFASLGKLLEQVSDPNLAAIGRAIAAAMQVEGAATLPVQP